MTEYLCRVGGPGGTIGERRVVADSAAAARERLAGEGMEVFRVRRRGGLRAWLAELRRPAASGADGPGEAAPGDGRSSRWWERRLSSRLKESDLLLLTEELAALVRAGLPLLRCLDILRGRRAGTVAGEVLDRVRERVAAGHDLSRAFAEEPPASTIPSLYLTTLTVGEASGDLEGALRRYAGHLERSQLLRRRVRAALLYPAALFSVSMAVIAILVGFVLPRFADFYATYGADLPFLTRMLVSGATFVQRWGLPVAGVLAVTVAVLVAWFRSEDGRLVRDRLVLRVPLLGGLRRLWLDLETSRTLATLLGGGAPVVEALEVAAGGCDNRAYRARLRRVAELVSQGTAMNRAFEEVDILDDMGLEMVEVGESTGSLDRMLEHVGQTYDEMLERRLETTVSLLEPAVLVSMGAFLAAVLLSLYMPLFNTVDVVR